MLLVFYFRFVNRGKFMDHVQGDKFYKHSIGLEKKIKNIYIYSGNLEIHINIEIFYSNSQSRIVSETIFKSQNFGLVGVFLV